MKLGDIVFAVGEVIAIDDWDRVTVKLCEGGTEAIIHMCDLRVIKEAENDVD